MDQELGLGSAGGPASYNIVWLTHEVMFSWQFGRGWSGQGVFRLLSTGLSPAEQRVSYMAAGFQDGRPALKITYHFCHILLAKRYLRGSTDSKRGNICRSLLVGEIANSRCKRACGREDVITAIFGTWSTVRTYFMLAGNPPETTVIVSSNESSITFLSVCLSAFY